MNNVTPLGSQESPSESAGRATDDDSPFRGRKYRQQLAGFNVYRTPFFISENIAHPRINTNFRGVPISSDATVVDVGTGDVTFALEPTQLNVVSRAECSLIESPIHGVTFRAYPTLVDAQNCRVTFAQFHRHHGLGAELRTNLRVELDAAIQVLLCFEGNEVSGSLVDVSVASLAVYIVDGTVNALQEGNQVEIRIPDLPGETEAGLKATGKVIRTMPVVDEQPGACRLVIYLSANESLHGLLNAYVETRRDEILAEITAAA